MAISSAEEILEDFRQGKMVLIMDDENRENEGDLIIAAEVVTPQHMTFMAREACGLICLTTVSYTHLTLPTIYSV